MNLKGITLASLCLSFILLVPGVVRPILSIKMSTKIDAGIASFDSKMLDKERSIIGTVSDLKQDGRYLVAFLILLFSVLIPIGKGLFLTAALFLQEKSKKLRSYQIVNSIAKWSMADVFVVAIFLVFLSTNGKVMAESLDINLFGMVLNVQIHSILVAEFLDGFYFFLRYCLISLASTHLVKRYLIKEQILSNLQ